MDQEYGDMEENLHITKPRRYWGLRPWKRHSVILMVAGALYVFIGVLYIRLPYSPSREATLKVVLQVAPIQFWGSVFVAAGLLSMISSRWPPFAEKWGYMALTGMSSGWSTTYLLGVLFFGSPSLVLSQVVLWAILAFLWWAVAGLSNPEHREVRSHEEL